MGLPLDSMAALRDSTVLPGVLRTIIQVTHGALWESIICKPLLIKSQVLWDLFCCQSTVFFMTKSVWISKRLSRDEQGSRGHSRAEVTIAEEPGALVLTKSVGGR